MMHGTYVDTLYIYIFNDRDRDTEIDGNHAAMPWPTFAIFREPKRFSENANSPKRVVDVIY